MGYLLNGIFIGLISAFFISALITTYINTSISIILAYIVLAPLFSVIGVLITYVSHKEEGQWFGEGEKKRKED